jgi:hypothetical protein
MNNPIWNLLRQMEPLSALSISHLTSTTRFKLAQGKLSVPSYPNDYGGFVYVGVRGDAIADEADLQSIIDVARSASLIWLKFDADAEVVDGLPIFRDEDDS